MGAALSTIILVQNRIEFSAGAHFAQNLILATFFLNIEEVTDQKFSWLIDPFTMSVEILSTALLVVWVFWKNKIQLKKIK